MSEIGSQLREIAFREERGLVGVPQPNSVKEIMDRSFWPLLIESFCAGNSLVMSARILRKSTTKIRGVAQNPEFQEELKKASESAHAKMMEQIKDARTHFQERLAEIADQGLDELEELILGAKSEKVKLEAINSALDRTPELSRKNTGGQNTGMGPSVVQFGVFLQQAAAVAKEIDVGHTDFSGNRAGRRVEGRDSG